MDGYVANRTAHRPQLLTMNTVNMRRKHQGGGISMVLLLLCCCEHLAPRMAVSKLLESH